MSMMETEWVDHSHSCRGCDVSVDHGEPDTACDWDGYCDDCLVDQATAEQMAQHAKADAADRLAADWAEPTEADQAWLAQEWGAKA